MMGLSRREARARLDAVLDFAELERVRRAEAQELLVRDDGAARVRRHGRGGRRHHARSTRCWRSATPPFAQKCMDVFRERATRDARSCSSRTTWRPSRASATARCSCTTASCSTSATPRRRRCATTASTSAAPGRRRAARGGVPDVNVRVVDAWLEDDAASASRTSSRASRSGSASCSRRGTSSTRRCSDSTSSTPTA